MRPAVFLLLLCAAASCKKSVEVPQEYAGLSAQQLIEKGLGFHQKGDYAASLRFFEYASVRDPKNHTAWFNQACALNRQGRADEAAAALLQALDLNSAWVTANLGDPDLQGLLQDAKSATGRVKDLALRIQDTRAPGIAGTWSSQFTAEAPDGCSPYNGQSVFAPDGTWENCFAAGGCYRGRYTVSGSTLEISQESFQGAGMPGQPAAVEVDRKEFKTDFRIVQHGSAAFIIFTNPPGIMGPCAQKY